jgi:hypothetical protein
LPGATEDGIATGDDGRVDQVAADFVKALARHRHWNREPTWRQVAV